MLEDGDGARGDPLQAFVNVDEIECECNVSIRSLLAVIVPLWSLTSSFVVLRRKKWPSDFSATRALKCPSIAVSGPVSLL